MIATGLVGTMTATHAFADEKYVLPYSYYYIGVSDDNTQHTYLQKSDSWTPDENGWNTAVLVQLNDDTTVQKGSFGETTATWNEIYFNCADATWVAAIVKPAPRKAVIGMRSEKLARADRFIMIPAP